MQHHVLMVNNALKMTVALKAVNVSLHSYWSKIKLRQMFSDFLCPIKTDKRQQFMASTK